MNKKSFLIVLSLFWCVSIFAQFNPSDIRKSIVRVEVYDIPNKNPNAYPIFQRDVNVMRKLTHVLSGKALLNMVVIDVYRRMHGITIHRNDAGSITPRQKPWIIRHIIHQKEHLLRAVWNKY